MSNNTTKTGEFTGRHMLMIMVAFFGVIIAVNLTMATLANTSWTGLVVKNGYVASQHFNAELSKSRAQAALNWKGTFSQSKTGIQFELRKPDGQFVDAQKITLILRRPTNELHDKRIVLDAMGQGIYGGRIIPKLGAWTAEINATVAEKDGKPMQWRMIYNILVKKDGSFSSIANEVM